MYPELTVDLDIIENNVRTVTSACAEHGIEVVGVSKVFCAAEPIIHAYVRGGITKIADSRIENLARINEPGCEKWLIRTPQLSRAYDAVKYADVSLNSDNTVISALAEAAHRLGKKHKIVLMYDLGDLREGYISHDDIKKAAELTRSYDSLELAGVGTNLTCFSFVHPDTEKLSELSDIASETGAAHYISGGNSATLDLMLRGGIPRGVNMLRLGESLLFGRERAHYKYLDGTRNDAFIMRAEIVECKYKPSMPWGTFGADSYGNRPSFTDKGIRKRIICALGKQDCDVETMWPTDPDTEIIGASSDHLVLDVTDSKTAYATGDTVELRLGYYSTLRAFTSEYVSKKYIHGHQTVIR